MKCINCGGEVFRAATMPHEVKIGSRVVRGHVPAQECVACGEASVEASALDRFELEVAEAVLREGVVDGDTFRFLRHALGLTAKDLATLIDSTPETISRWEKGARPVDRAAWLALAMLVADQHDGRSRARGIVDAAARPGGSLPSQVKVPA